jgi:hypothetical protein
MMPSIKMTLQRPGSGGSLSSQVVFPRDRQPLLGLVDQEVNMSTSTPFSFLHYLDVTKPFCRTETKAITTWPISQLTPLLPKIMHSYLRASKYYTAQKDCLSFQAQDSRSRTVNTEENVKKLWEEISRIYEEAVPSETSPEKRQKYAQL